MSDYRTGRVEGKKKQAFNGLFFTFSKPYLDLLARGSIFYLSIL
jgi:hypothetical protein